MERIEIIAQMRKTTKCVDIVISNKKVDYFLFVGYNNSR